MKHFAFILFQKFNQPEIFQHVDLTKFLSKVPRIYCKYELRGKFSQYFLKEDIAKIKELNLDFIFRFGFNIIRGEILNSARYGVWSYHHGDEQKYRGTPPGFWEIYNGDRITGAILQRLTDVLHAGIVLKKGYFKTYSYSWKLNLELLYQRVIKWPAQICIDIFYGNADYLQALPSTTMAPIHYAPNNSQMARFLIKLFQNMIQAH